MCVIGAPGKRKNSLCWIFLIAMAIVVYLILKILCLVYLDVPVKKI